MIRKTHCEGGSEGGREGGRRRDGGRERGVLQKSLEHSKLLHEFVRALINHATTQ
jgi:hypothetical protein